MDPKTPLRILSLDGGGIRGISSLYILKDLLEQIERDRKAEARHTELRSQAPLSPLRPCDIFDLICGTSTGGLIALMLGRLEMVSRPIPTVRWKR
jgi:patatin-like phospholipase/acyl hydrolase